MNKYTIQCTDTQTHKALELGAPIRIDKVHDVLDEYSLTLAKTTHDVIHNPTAEQLIGWLEEQGISIDVYLNNPGYEWNVYEDNRNNVSKRLQEMFPHHMKMVELSKHFVSTRKEAFLAAIDAALEYLTNK